MYPDGSTWFAAALLQLPNNRVLHETWYFAAPADPPAWRAQRVERIG